MELAMYIAVAIVLPLVILTIDKYFFRSALWEDNGVGANHVMIYYGIMWPIGVVVGGALLVIFGPIWIAQKLFQPRRDDCN